MERVLGGGNSGSGDGRYVLCFKQHKVMVLHNGVADGSDDFWWNL